MFPFESEKLVFFEPLILDMLLYFSYTQIANHYCLQSLSPHSGKTLTEITV